MPQFIEVEDKIFGPFSFRQFVYIVGGAGLAFIFWRLLPLLAALPLMLAAAGLGLSLAFYKPNNRPFVEMLESAFRYTTSNKLYLWKHRQKEVEKKRKSQEPSRAALVDVPKLSQSKLKDLAWELDIKESVYTDETKPQ